MPKIFLSELLTGPSVGTSIVHQNTDFVHLVVLDTKGLNITSEESGPRQKYSKPFFLSIRPCKIAFALHVGNLAQLRLGATDDFTTPLMPPPHMI